MNDKIPKIIVSGLINLETTLRIDNFPLDYFPVSYPFGGINSSVSGVGFNVAAALQTLGADTALLSLAGNDCAADLAEAQLRGLGLSTETILRVLEKTPQSVIIFDGSGRRQIHVDLKDIQAAAYPAESFRRAAANADLAVLCNINFSRALLGEAQKLAVPVACDVHAISSVNDDYNADFMRASDILFFSDERIGGDAGEFALNLAGTYPCGIIVAGMGADGALLYERKTGVLTHFPAALTRPVVNTIGAGDALFSAFIYYHLKTRDAKFALARATAFASYKIGANGGAEGFLTETDLERVVSGLNI